MIQEDVTTNTLLVIHNSRLMSEGEDNALDIHGETLSWKRTRSHNFNKIQAVTSITGQ